MGCGGGNAVDIHGTVSVAGTPVEAGKIIYRSMESASGSGSGGSASVVNGEYQLDGVPIGRCVFTFSGVKLTGKTIPGPGGQQPERVNVIPQQVLSDGVERDIQGSGTQDFALAAGA